jgi:ligand-binding sensor domain-containing protein/two-component sensor histidine kinase
MRQLFKILWLVCFLYCGNISAQSISYKIYGIKDGLPGNNIFRIYHDREGYIWLSCDYGLSRFDGYKFRNYSYESVNGTVLAIDEDGDDLWVSVTHTYQYVLRGKEPKEYKPQKGTISPTVIKMQIDDNKRRWLLNTMHYIQYIENNTVRTLYLKSNSGEILNVNDIHYDRSTGFLIATDSGIYKLNDNKTFSFYNTSLPQLPSYCIATDYSNNVYFGFDGYICILGKTGLSKINVKDNKSVTRLAAYNPSRIWFLSIDPGFYILENGKETTLSESLNLKNVFFNDLFCDRTGLLFLATNGKGLYTLYNTGTVLYNGQNGLSGNSVFSLCNSNDGVFIGSRGKINLYKDEKISEIDVPVKIDEKVNAMMAIGDDLWIASPFHVFKYNIKTKKYISFFPGATCFALDEKGDILAGGYDMIYSIDKNINKACTLDHYFPKIQGKRVNSIFYDDNTGYWFGAGRGITLYKNNDTIVFADSIPTGTRMVTFSIKKDIKGNIWFATTKGIATYDQNHNWHIYKTTDGLPDNVGICLLPDKDKMLIGTARGLASYDGAGFTKYTPENGFPINEISAILVKDSNLFLGTSEGLYICKNYQTKPNIPLPTIHFTSFRYGDSTIPHRDTISIPYGNRSLMIDFTAIEYRRQEYIVYEYRINKGHWYELQIGSLPLTSLSPGNYTIEIRTKHKTTNKVSAAKSITIIVLPPFWQRWWFMLLCMLIVALIAGSLISWRIKRIKQREKIRTQRYTRLLQLKQQATNALMSPHFIFNALNSIQHFINQSDALSANRFLTKFAKMIRTTMENSARLNIKLREEIELLELYLSLEALRLNGKLTYEVIVDEILDKERTLLPSILIQPYVENAVWHGIVPKGSPGKIIVEIKKQDNNFLSITIQDDGVGIDLSASPKEGKHKSLGLKLNEDRLKMIEKLTGNKASLETRALYNDNGVKTGTRVKILLPADLS